jgi:hypothetical protein
MLEKGRDLSRFRLFFKKKMKLQGELSIKNEELRMKAFADAAT